MRPEVLAWVWWFVVGQPSGHTKQLIFQNRLSSTNDGPEEENRKPQQHVISPQFHHPDRSSCNVVCTVSDLAWKETTENLAIRLGLLLVAKDDPFPNYCTHALSVTSWGMDDYAIGIHTIRTAARGRHRWDHNPWIVDFVSNSQLNRRLFHKNERLVQAVQPHKHPIVWDWTAGWGQDSMLLACAGATVVMVERNPIVTCLLHDGLRRLADQDLSKRLTLVVGDATQTMTTTFTPRPHVVYLDPMFPPRTKKASVKKNMQILHAVTQSQHGLEASNDQQLWTRGCEVAMNRVVVKRPIHAPWLADQKPSYELRGSVNRFDVYLVS